MGDSLSGLSLDSAKGAYSKYSNTTVDTNAEASSSSYLDFDSYLEILSAKMSNQDFNDPMNDSEMLQQMSSYSMLEGIKQMTSQANISYATSLVGKAVTVTDTDGTMSTGIVESVTINDSTPYLVVNGGQYKATGVTDISDSDVYNELSKFIGHNATATVTMSGEESSVTGEVTDVLIKDGGAYVVIKNTLYNVEDIKVDMSDSTETEQAQETDSEETTTVTGSVTADTQEYFSNYVQESDKLFDELLKTTDSVSNTSVTKTINPSDYPELSQYNLNISYVSTPDYAAGYMSQDDEVLSVEALAQLSADGIVTDLNSIPASNVGGTQSPVQNVTATELTNSLSAGLYDVPITADNVEALSAASRKGRVSSLLTDGRVKNIISSGEYNVRYSKKYGLEVQSDTKPGISISDCVPHRLNPEKYPEEAALADALGTRMYDIKFINNTAITSRIDTSTVIGTTIDGRQITEIGYSGEGQLGEVVTFADGTQRVEVINRNGTSGWFNTSGNYTLDEICGKSLASFEKSANFTPIELAIRNYAH